MHADLASALPRVLSRPQELVQVRPGLVVLDEGTGGLAVNVDGARPVVLWPVGVFFAPGDVVRVLVTPEGAEVLAPVLPAPRPVTGTVAGAAVDGRVPVTTSVGEVHARYTGSSPSLGAVVRLDWAGTEPWAWPGEVASSTPPRVEVTGPPAPPAPAQTGLLTASAVSSASWAVHRGQWSSTTGTDVLQGSWGSLTYTGAWWYGARLIALEGRTLTRARIWLAARRRQGAYNAPAEIHLYRHSQAQRGSAEPPRVQFLLDLSLPPGWAGGWRDLGAAAGQALVDSGGGIAIAGGPYAGLLGVAGDARSGCLEFEWRR